MIEGLYNYVELRLQKKLQTCRESIAFWERRVSETQRSLEQQNKGPSYPPRNESPSYHPHHAVASANMTTSNVTSVRNTSVTTANSSFGSNQYSRTAPQDMATVCPPQNGNNPCIHFRCLFKQSNSYHSQSL
jgi:hypothetical protein